MTGEQPMHPIDPALLPFQVGEVVAFREDHPEHGTKTDSNGDVTDGAKYGKVVAVGVLEDGTPAFDLDVFDPFYGARGPVADGEEEPERVIHRATMSEIQ